MNQNQLINRWIHVSCLSHIPVEQIIETKSTFFDNSFRISELNIFSGELLSSVWQSDSPDASNGYVKSESLPVSINHLRMGRWGRNPILKIVIIHAYYTIVYPAVISVTHEAKGRTNIETCRGIPEVYKGSPKKALRVNAWNNIQLA